MFGQQNQQQRQQISGGLFGAAPQLGGSTGGFSFGTGSSTGATSSGSASGFGFPAPTQQPASTGFSFGAGSSGATATPGTTGSFTFGATPATQTGGFSFGGTPSRGLGFGTPATTVASTTTPQTGGFTFGSASTGISLGAPATQPASTGLKLGSTGVSGFTFGNTASTATPAAGGITLGAATTVAGSSPFMLGKTTAATGPLSTGFSLGGTTAQPGRLLGSAQAPTVSAQSQGFSFGEAKTTAPATVTPTQAFSFGGVPTAATSAPTGLTLGISNAGAIPSSGFSFGAPQPTTKPGGLTLGGVAQSATATSASSTPSTGLTLGFPAPASNSATPLLSSLLGTTKTTAAPATSAASTGLAFGSKLPATTTITTTTSAGLSLPGTGGIKFGTTSATSLSTATTTVAAGLGSIASTTSTSSSSATSSAVASSVPQLTYKQLEEHINKWAVELADYEKTFLDQAAQVNAWDRLLMENGEKITELNASVENVKAEQKRLDQELDFIMAQQQELEEMLKPLEDAVRTGTSGSRQLQQADKERDITYKLAKDIDGQLKQMVQDLKSIIDHLNTANTQQQDSDDPITQIAKILNAHMNSLQWVDQNSGILQRKVDEIARLSETRRKEQERNFRLAFD